MKKILAILLCVMFMLVILCATCAVADAPEPADTPAPVAFTVNLTGLIVAILVAVFEFLLAWLLKAVIPPAKRWLESHTTKNQQQIIWNVVLHLVEAAEQTITGAQQGEKKLRYVKDMLEAHGFKVDTYVIEAAVHEMNNRLLGEIAHELNVETSVDVGEPEDEDLEDDETE